MAARRRSSRFDRLLGVAGALAVATGIGWMLATLDLALVLGLVAGVPIALGWRWLHRFVRARLDLVTASISTVPLRVAVGTVQLAVPFLVSPFGVALLVLADLRFGLAAFLVVLGDTFLRAALGREVGPAPV